ncbi:NECAP endocytosis-associated protein 2 [Intoshia linei]|uniref:NECAP endocytosis-associated protein 2 n=1 Tax=Intoshia linei TaxID=1819745 RepID=A0A177BCV0_9BILA|nr:NECAP endocytosis-associated protein 2 [Intoshia linei]
MEYVVLVKHKVAMYKIKPRTSNQPYKAQKWLENDPNWIGKLQVIVIGETDCKIRLVDELTNKLFAEAVIEPDYPNGTSFETVSDSSRYFAITLLSPSGRKCTVGIGFNERSDSFDLTAALNDHFDRLVRHKPTKPVVIDSSNANLDESEQYALQVKQQNEDINNRAHEECRKLKLSDNEKIKLNLNFSDSKTNDHNKPHKFSGNLLSGGLLPPPPKR